MKITQIRIFPVREDKLKAFVSVILDNCFVVSDIKIIEGTQGLFVSMPSKRRKNGTFRDIAHPLNSETRRRFEDEIIGKYREILAEEGGPSSARLRELGASEPRHEGRSDGRDEPLSAGGSPAHKPEA